MNVRAVAVIVPAHDEEELIGACLASIETAARAVDGVEVAVFVVLDACTDASAEIAARSGFELVPVQARCVGVARATGVARALESFARLPSSAVWTAHTDADSTVPENWLTVQLEHARAGSDVVIGTVRPDFRELSPRQRRAWHATHVPGVANGHVHGANLGIRADALLAAGGFDAVPEHEDVQLVDRVRAAGAVLTASDAAWVRTSGRAHGRTPGGYARYLREDLVPAASGT